MEERSLSVQGREEISPYDGAVISKDKMSDLMDEMVSSVKDCRLNTKRVISADIASTARIQSQYGLYVAACERELCKKDLTEETRKEILSNMFEACKASEMAGMEGRDFQREELELSRTLPWKIFGVLISIIAAGYIGGVVYRSVRV